MSMQLSNQIIYKKSGMAFTCDPEGSVHDDRQTPQSTPPQDGTKGRRKRSDRGRSAKDLFNQDLPTNFYATKKYSVKESEMTNVLTMDQFANFLLKKSSFVESRETSEQDPETFRKEGSQIQDCGISEESKRRNTFDEQQDSEIQYNELQFNDETQLGDGVYSQEGCGSARLFRNSSQKSKVKRDVKSSLSQNVQQQQFMHQKRTPQKYEVSERKKHQDYEDQISYFHNASPSAINQRSQFSPTTPISIINNEPFNQMSPQQQKLNEKKEAEKENKVNDRKKISAHFNDCESNFALELLEEGNGSTNFKDTMKSHASTDIRSAMAELENINQKMMQNRKGYYGQAVVESQKIEPNKNNEWDNESKISNTSKDQLSLTSKFKQSADKIKNTTQPLQQINNQFVDTKQNSLNTSQEYNSQPNQKVKPKFSEDTLFNYQEKQNSNDMNEKNFILMQYEYVLQQLNQQVNKLLSKNQELEQTNISNEMLISQQKQCISELKQQVQNEKSQGEQKVVESCNKIKDHLEGELDKHKQVLTFYSQELDLQRTINGELEQRIQQFQQSQVSQKRIESELLQRLEESNKKQQSLDQLLKKKDEEIYKLRQDNSTLFSDLKQLANNEESYKMDIIENKNKRVEMQVHIEELSEKCQSQDQKIKQLQSELEKTKREGQVNLDQTKIMERNIDELKRENDQLKDKLTMMDQERQNLLNEKERRERDCKNMQADLNRFNAMIHAYKNLGGAQNLPHQGQQEQQQRNTGGQFQQQQQPQQQHWQKLFGQQINQQQNERQVFKASDINQQSIQQPPIRTHYNNEGWTNNSQNHQERYHNSNGKYQDMSPLKKSDPNIPYVQRQKMMQTKVVTSPQITPFNNQQQNQTPQFQSQNKQSFVGNVQNQNLSNLQATLQNLLVDKQRLESEYSKVPITINGKSMQIRKKKEELEFELDLVEKNINHVSMKIKEAQHTGF